MSASERASAGHPAWLQNLERANDARARRVPSQLGNEGAMRVTLWAIQLHRFPTPRDIMDRWGVCRATAYRLRASLASAFGVIPPPSPPGETDFSTGQVKRARH